MHSPGMTTTSQSRPCHSGVHVQVKELTRLLHTPPFWQGSLSHSLISATIASYVVLQYGSKAPSSYQYRIKTDFSVTLCYYRPGERTYPYCSWRQCSPAHSRRWTCWSHRYRCHRSDTVMTHTRWCLQVVRKQHVIAMIPHAKITLNWVVGIAESISFFIQVAAAA